MLAPAPRRGGHARAQGQRPADALEPRRQGDVLHQRNGRKAAHGLERRAGDEHRLIAGGDAGEARARVHHGWRSSRAARRRRCARRNGPRRGPNGRDHPAPGGPHRPAGGCRRAGTSGRRRVRAAAPAFICMARPVALGHHPVGEAARKLRRAVAAAAVGDDHFDAAPPVNLQRRQAPLRLSAASLSTGMMMESFMAPPAPANNRDHRRYARGTTHAPANPAASAPGSGREIRCWS